MGDNGLHPDELARQAGALLPDREALSLIDGGGLLATPGGGLADPMGFGGGEDVDAGDAGAGASDLAGGLGDGAMDHADDADAEGSISDQPRSDTITDSDASSAVS